MILSLLATTATTVAVEEAAKVSLQLGESFPCFLNQCYYNFVSRVTLNGKSL